MKKRVIANLDLLNHDIFGFNQKVSVVELAQHDRSIDYRFGNVPGWAYQKF
jgi:hypothetical protein